MNVRRIRRLRIEGFGHFREQEWEIHPRLQLFTGRNEAGKSTLLAFVRGVLFGFEPRASARRYEPFSGGPFGGAVWMDDDSGRCVQIRRSGQDRAAGRLTVALPDGRTAGEDWLRQWLGGIDKSTYRQVFAFGLDDLQQVRWLKDEALTPFLYHTLTGGGPLEPVKKSLTERETVLFRPRGKSGQIHVLLRELDDLQARCRELRRQQQDAAHVRRRLAEVETEVAALEREIGTLQEQMERLDRAARLLEPYRRLRSLAEALRQDGLAPLQDEGSGAIGPAGYWEERRAKEEARLEELRRGLEAVVAERTELSRRLDGASAERPEGRPRPRTGRVGREKEPGRIVPAVLAALGLVTSAGWLWLHLAWRGELHPASWVPAAVFLLAGAGGAYMYQKKMSRRRRMRKRLAEARERLRQEEERLLRELTASEQRVACLREAETLDAVLGPWRTDPVWRRHLAAWAARSDAERAAERERLETALAERMQRYAAGLEERGRLLQQLDGARKKREELAEMEQRLQQRKAELQRLVRQWSAAVLARRALEETVAAYERERQPHTLQRASVYLTQLTGGRYRQVLAPYGERELLVEREDGERLRPVHLSRGTVEQLLLAMRLALADEYSSRAVLPLMMDDIFVNFDAGRLASAVETLNALGRRRQILFLTCHPHVEAAFRQALAGEDWGHQVLDGRSS